MDHFQYFSARQLIWSGQKYLINCLHWQKNQKKHILEQWCHEENANFGPKNFCKILKKSSNFFNLIIGKCYIWWYEFPKNQMIIVTTISHRHAGFDKRPPTLNRIKNTNLSNWISNPVSLTLLANHIITRV